MSCFTLIAANYSDFKSVVDDILTSTPGRVYYHTATIFSASVFQCVFVADDISRMVALVPLSGSSTPTSFSTDFPSAISLTDTAGWSLPSLGNNGYNLSAN